MYIMANSISHHSCFLYASLVYVSLLLLCMKNGAFAFQGRKIAESHHLHPLIQTIKASDLLPSATACKPSNRVGVGENGAAASLTVVHKYGPCSSLNANAPSLAEILTKDQARVESIHSRVSDLKETEAAKLPAKRGVSVGTGNYIVTVGLGTPRKDLSVIFDTGSDLTWARCRPGIDTLDPTKSTTYSNISCSSPFCSSVISATGFPPRCASSTCEYGLRYVDGSSSVGFLGKEKLSIGSTDVFNDFYFGCSQKNEGLFGNAGGLMGLGRAKLSLVSQTASTYNKLFSYCIPSSSSSTGFLSFGATQSKSAKFTPLSTSSSDFYALDLTGITVGGRKLAISSSVFSNAGTIIDSGTVITRLPPAAYAALRSAFREMMSNYTIAQPFSIFDTCYDFSKSETIEWPQITFSFNGVDVEIDKSGIFAGPSVQQVCLAFAGNRDERQTGILGNTQQRTYEVVHDVSGGKVGFAPGGCT